MRPFAYVRLRDVLGRGTLVTVTMSAPQFARVFFGVWFGFLAFWAVLVTFLSAGEQHTDLTAISFAAGMALLGGCSRCSVEPWQAGIRRFSRAS